MFVYNNYSNIASDVAAIVLSSCVLILTMPTSLMSSSSKVHKSAILDT